jgi:hypothetical protein
LEFTTDWTPAFKYAGSAAGEVVFGPLLNAALSSSGIALTDVDVFLFDVGTLGSINATEAFT